MKARVLILAGLLLAAGAAQGEANNADAITGVWKTDSGGYIQIYDAGDHYAGRIVGAADPGLRYDKHNPDPDKRGRPLLGAVVVHSLEYEGDMTWGGGTIYDPYSGETYQLKAYLRAPDKLEIRGYIGVSLFGRSQYWKPVPLDARNLANDKLVPTPAKQAKGRG